MNRYVKCKARFSMCVASALFSLLWTTSVSAQLAATLIVSVADQDTGQIIQGAAVTLSPGSTVYSNSSGIASFAGLPAGNYSVAVSKTGYTTDNFSVSLSSGQIKGEDAELRTTYSLDSGPQYQVKNSAGTVLARFDQDGNLQVSGSIVFNATTGELAATSGKELLIKSGSTIVARMDSSGDLYVKGVFTRRLTSISLGAAQAFRVKNSAGTTVAAIDESGNLKILGGSNGF